MVDKANGNANISVISGNKIHAAVQPSPAHIEKHHTQESIFGMFFSGISKIWPSSSCSIPAASLKARKTLKGPSSKTKKLEVLQVAKLMITKIRSVILGQWST